MHRNPGGLKANLWLALGWFTVFVTLGLTLGVYRTSLNPGLPIILGCAATALWAILSVTVRRNPAASPSLDLTLALGLWMALATWYSVDGYVSQRSLATYLGAIGFMLAVQATASESWEWNMTAWAVVTFCSLVCVSAWGPAVVTAIETRRLGLLMGPFVNQDTFAVVPMVGLALGAGLADQGSRGVKALLSLQLGLQFVSLLATGCRAAMVGIFAAGLVAFGLLLMHRKDTVTRLGALLAAPLVVLTLFVPLSFTGVPILAKWSRIISADETENEDIRWELATHGWKAIRDHALHGSGPGTFGLAYQSVRPEQRSEYHYINIAHNDFLEMGVETGLIGLAMWLGIFWFVLSEIKDHLRRGRRPASAAGVLAALISMLVFSLFNFIIAERPVLWLQFLVLGLAISFPSSRRRASKNPALRTLLLLALLPLSVWGCYFGWRSLKTDALAAAADISEKRLLLEDAARQLNSAIALQPGRVALLQKRAEISARLAAYTGKEEFEQARVRYLSLAHAASPGNVPVMLQLADHYALQKDYAQEQKLLDLAYKTAPGNPVVIDRFVAGLVRGGRFREAAELLQPKAQREGSTALDQLASLTVAMEREKAGQGLNFAKAFQQNASEQLVQDFFGRLDSHCAKSGKPALQRQFLEVQLGLDPSNICLKLQIAATLGAENGTQAEFSTLTRTVQGLTSGMEPCAGDLVSRWTALGLQLDRVAEVEKGLRGLLEDNPNVPAIRVALGQTLSQRGQLKEAIATVKDGLESNQYSYPLLMEMGRLYEAAGSADLALNYYREAARAREDDTVAKESIRRLTGR
jgi:O-antigen ligase/tetratricopeptide (TPR) repeat protein